MTLQPEPLGIMTQGKLVLRKEDPRAVSSGQSNVEDPETTAGAVGGVTLLIYRHVPWLKGQGNKVRVYLDHL